ncbi:MAG TPA: diguanylate cyclase [Labilithrix sp.]|nr:diguanylate cyclase [Labilithrix sp.]
MPGDANRLRVLGSTRLLDSPPERAFDRLTRLAAGLLGAPTALVSLVDERRQFFKSALGLGEPWASQRETPLSYSFCQYVARDKAPLIVGDAREEPMLRDNLAVRELGVIAYAGIPLVVANEAIGAFCVVDTSPREWSEEQVQLLTDLAESVVSEIELRLTLRNVEEQRALTSVLLESLGDGVVAVNRDRTLIVVNAAARRLFTTPLVGGQMTGDWRGAPRSRRADGAKLTSEDDELSRALRGEPTDGFDFSVESPDGSAVRIETTARPVFDTSGTLIAAVGVYRDVTAKRLQAELYTTLVENVPRAAVMLFDRELQCLAIDGGLTRGEGADRSALVGRNLAELAGLSLDAPEFATALDAYRRTLEGETVEFDFVHGERTLLIHTAPVFDALGGITSGLVLALDVTRERQLQTELRTSEQVYRGIVQNLPNGAVLMLDRQLRYVKAEGPVVGDILRVANLDSIVGKTLEETVAKENREHMLSLYRSVFAGETRHVELTRGERFYDLNMVPIFDAAGVSHALVSVVDVTTRKAELVELEKARVLLEEQARELQEVSVTDSLTGLLNRRGFTLIAEQEMRAASRAGRELLLFFVDMNGMKTINDTLGHAVGDQALVETGKLLRGVFRNADVVARLGGDEFVVLATDAVTSCAPAVSARLTSALEKHNQALSQFKLSLSVGTSVFDPKRPTTLDEMLSQADAKMYAEKQSSRATTSAGRR